MTKHKDQQQVSPEKLMAGGILLATAIILFILALVFFGTNRRAQDNVFSSGQLTNPLTWTGAASNKMSDPNNWQPKIKPSTVHSLIFPGNYDAETIDNDLSANTVVKSFNVEGGTYAFTGNELWLSDGIATNYENTPPWAGFDVTIKMPLKFEGTDFTVANYKGSLKLENRITLGSPISFSTLTNATTSVDNLFTGNNIVGAFGISKQGDGTLELKGTNTFTGDLTIVKGTVVVSSGNALGATTGRTTVGPDATLKFFKQSSTEVISLSEPITLLGGNGYNNQGVILAAHETRLSGPLNLSGNIASVLKAVSGYSLYLTNQSQILGTHELQTYAEGAGAIYIESNNTYPGQFAVKSGRLVTTGNNPNATVALLGANAKYHANGVIKNVNMHSATGELDAGGNDNVGKFEITSSLSGIVAPAGNTASGKVIFDLVSADTSRGNNHASGDYDVITLKGAASIKDLELVIKPKSGFTPKEGDTFKIINKTSAGLVQGVFKDANGPLPEGASATAAGVKYQISYKGGDGNDVVLKVLGTTGSDDPTSAALVYRFYDKKLNHHFYTISEAEKDDLIANNPNWNFEGSAYKAFYKDQCAAENDRNLSQVYRFYSAVYKVHFYTISETEKDKVIATDKNWNYEGVAYCALKNERLTGTDSPYIELFRFWSNNYRAHFYTASEAEKDNLKDNNPNWNYEGVAYKVLPKTYEGEDRI